MQNEQLINNMLSQLKKDNINHSTTTNNNCANITFTKENREDYTFAISILERYSGNQACVYHEDGEGKNKVIRIETLTDELYYERLKQLIKYILK